MATLLARLNGVLWSGSGGLDQMDLLSARISPQAGTLQIASAGTLQAVVVRKATIEPVEIDSPAIGTHEETCLRELALTLSKGDALIAIAHSPAGDGSTTAHRELAGVVGQLSDELRSAPAARLAEAVLRLLNLQGTCSSPQGRAVLVIKRS